MEVVESPLFLFTYLWYSNLLHQHVFHATTLIISQHLIEFDNILILRLQ